MDPPQEGYFYDRLNPSRQTRTYSVHSIIKIIKGQDQEKGDELASLQKSLYELKRDIALQSKRNFTLERDIRNLDKKISLLIRNRISVEEIMANSGDLSLMNKPNGQIKNKKEREAYGELFWLLQNDTKYIATLARLVNLGQIDNLLQTVMFTLYGNQYDEMEEHLLLSMFRSVLDAEFREATGIGSLLRANTALTRMMTTYTRRGPGQQYLKTTLTGVLSNLCSQSNLVLEINPLKVYIEMINEYEIKTGQKSTLNRKVTAEEAAENSEVQNIIRPHILTNQLPLLSYTPSQSRPPAYFVAKLDQIAGEFIGALLSSTDHVPYGIRWICKQIRELVRRKFPEATREQVCGLIGGFYLLRFINPAIVTPQAFMLVENTLSANTRRNLTLLAKILQNLANNIKFGGVKEFYMEPLNVCIDKNKETLNEFLEGLTAVENLEQHLNLDKYLALERTNENMINISFNEMYFIHEMLHLHKNSLCVEDRDPLGALLDKMGPAPSQLPKKDNANIDLVLSDSFREEDAQINGKLTPEQMYAETKFLLFTIIKSLPEKEVNECATVEATLNAAWKWAKEHSDKHLLEKIKRIQKNCQDLVKVGYLKESDNYAQLRRDAAQELFNYEEQSKKARVLLERLDSVLKNVTNHQKFLEDQYEAYKKYLQDVTSKCGVQTSNGKTKKKKDKVKSGKEAGPFKFPYNQLEKDGIIKESSVPKEKKSNIVFHFSSSMPGVYKVVVKVRSIKVTDMELELADLLERQQENRLDYITEYLTFDVNLLLHLLNTHFVSK